MSAFGTIAFGIAVAAFIAGGMAFLCWLDRVSDGPDAMLGHHGDWPSAPGRLPTQPTYTESEHV